MLRVVDVEVVDEVVVIEVAVTETTSVVLGDRVLVVVIVVKRVDVVVVLRKRTLAGQLVTVGAQDATMLKESVCSMCQHKFPSTNLQDRFRYSKAFNLPQAV